MRIVIDTIWLLVLVCSLPLFAAEIPMIFALSKESPPLAKWTKENILLRDDKNLLGKIIPCGESKYLLRHQIPIGDKGILQELIAFGEADSSGKLTQLFSEGSGRIHIGKGRTGGEARLKAYYLSRNSQQPDGYFLSLPTEEYAKALACLPNKKRNNIKPGLII